MNTRAVFGTDKAIIGMIHVGALPGTPRSRQSVAELAEHAGAEARLYADAGVQGLLIENMHDVPYLAGQVGPEIVAGMTAVGIAVREASRLPLGVQILAAANREALAVAQACGAAFVRAENFAYAHVADEGLLATAEAGPLLRYRWQIGAEHIAIWADVKKKHASHAITADVSLEEAARTTAFFGADALIVTGAATGDPAAVADVRTVRDAVRGAHHSPPSQKGAGGGSAGIVSDVPAVCIGSGLTSENLPHYWPHTDVFIVGSTFKVGGLWSNAIDPQRVAAFMRAVAKLRE